MGLFAKYKRWIPPGEAGYDLDWILGEWQATARWIVVSIIDIGGCTVLMAASAVYVRKKIVNFAL